jgi:small neutral amino acid transporter SnatA (MarC family)
VSSPPARELVSYGLLVLVSVVCVANPVHAALSFARATRGLEPGLTRRLGRRVWASSLAVLLATAWVGNVVAQLVTIHTGGLRVAVGLTVLVHAMRRMLAPPDPFARPAPSADEPAGEPSPDGPAPGADVAPSIAAGLVASVPTMGTVAIYAGETSELWRKLVTVGAVLAMSALLALLLGRAERVRGALGPSGARWLSGAMDLVTAAWAVDFTAIGVRDLLPLVLQGAPAR